MLYRLFAKFNDDFGLLVFLIYLGLFLLAFVSVFLFPPLALALVLLGLLGFVGVWFVVVIMRSIEQALARKAFSDGQCPCCAGELATSEHSDPLGGQYRICGRCDQIFEHRGRRAQEEDMLEDDEGFVSTL